jgi:hypothetical protein
MEREKAQKIADRKEEKAENEAAIRIQSMQRAKVATRHVEALKAEEYSVTFSGTVTAAPALPGPGPGPGPAAAAHYMGGAYQISGLNVIGCHFTS